MKKTEKKLSGKDVKPPTIIRALTTKEHGLVTIIMGINMGDEGKGKQAQGFGIKTAIGARFGGGGNSGHTVYPFPGVDIKVALNHLPGCSVNKNGIPCLGRGMVIDPKGLLTEIDNLRALGFLQDPCLPMIDARAHVVMPYHFILDDPDGKIGSTKKGIGPAYTDKAARRGIRMIDLLNIGALHEKVKEALDFHNVYFRHLGLPEMAVNPIVDEFHQISEDFLLFRIIDVGEYLLNALERGCDVIAEGHQGDGGIGVESIGYPYVTSSDTSAAFFCGGTGVPMKFVGDIYGIFKAYSTSVGAHPIFLTKQDNVIGEKLRIRGKEFGATTGRPRDCGWLDAASIAEVVRRNGITGVIMNKLDVLSGFSTVCICTGYEDDTGKQFDMLPEDFALRKMKPRYLELPGWNKEIIGVQDIKKLPKNARKFIAEVQRRLGAPIIGVGTGPHPEDMIWIE